MASGWPRWSAAAILVIAAAGAAAGSIARFVGPATQPTRVPPLYRAAPLPVPRPAAPAPVATPTAATAAQSLVIRHVIDTGGPLRFGDYFWNDTAAAAPGALTITVDLKASVLSVFRGGDEIGTTAVIYGADAKQTPLGTFPIMAKDRRHFSSTYNRAPMPYMLRLTNDGVSIHASEVAADYATHGCIGVPAGFARRLFDVARVGDRVIVTRRGVQPAAGRPDPPAAATTWLET